MKKNSNHLECTKTNIKVSFSPYVPLLASIPNQIQIAFLEPNKGRKALNLKELFLNALANPIGCPPLENLLYKKAEKNNKSVKECKILLLCDDHTRMTPVKLLLPWLIEYFDSYSIQYNNIAILIAGGSHRSMTPEEIKEKFGQRICETFRIIQHKFDAQESLISLGKTQRGIEVIVNKVVKDFDFLCAIGNIVPHEIAGFSGGAKMILPGISTEKTVGDIHWLSTKTPFHERLGSISNPIRVEINEAIEMVQLDFIINTLLNSRHELVNFFMGDAIVAHIAGCQESKKIYGVQAAPTEIVVTDTEPEHTDFWTAVKGILHTASFVKKGGVLICVSACPEGLCKEHPQILEMGYKSPEYLENNYLKSSKKGIKEYNRLTATHCANLWEILQYCEVFLVTRGITREQAEFLGLTYFADLQSAVDEALTRHPNIKRINCIRNGAEILFEKS